MLNLRAAVTTAALLLASACSKGEPAPAPSPAPSQSATTAAPAAPAATPAPAAAAASPADEARALFATGGLCNSCHGSTGHGDGPAAAALQPKPRSYTDAAWQASVTDADLAKVIKMGGAAVGKSAFMPPSPQLSDATIAELVKIIRSFKQ